MAASKNNDKTMTKQCHNNDKTITLSRTGGMSGKKISKMVKKILAQTKTFYKIKHSYC